MRDSWRQLWAEAAEALGAPDTFGPGGRVVAIHAHGRVGVALAGPRGEGAPVASLLLLRRSDARWVPLGEPLVERVDDGVAGPPLIWLLGPVYAAEEGASVLAVAGRLSDAATEVTLEASGLATTTVPGGDHFAVAVAVTSPAPAKLTIALREGRTVQRTLGTPASTYEERGLR